MKLTYFYSSKESSDTMKSFLSKLLPKKEHVQIEFCQNNIDRFYNEKTLAAFGSYLKNPQIRYKEYECLSECARCRKSPYAKVNGQLLHGLDAEDLLHQLQDKLNE